MNTRPLLMAALAIPTAFHVPATLLAQEAGLAGTRPAASAAEAPPAASAARRSFLPATAPLPAFDLEAFDAFVDTVMADWHVPGIAVGAIRDGEVVLAKGYGHRDVENGLPMTERTLLRIGSVTKSFTAVLLAMLEDDGVLDWDEPVRTYLPEFELRDAYATRHATLRDLLSHRTGLPRHDVASLRPIDRETLVRELRHLEPSASFRERFQYSNLMFATAGHVAERVTGRPWGALVHERIFEPLGMSRTITSHKLLWMVDDHAVPYREWNGRIERIPFHDLGAIDPAGAIHSSVEDMLRYLRFQLDEGESDGRRLLSAANARALRTPHTVGGALPPYAELGAWSYGLGHYVRTYRGRIEVQHGGTTRGFMAYAGWLPDEDIGVVVLMNLRTQHMQLPPVVAWRLFDLLLGLEPIDWNARALEANRRQEQQWAALRDRDVAERVEGTSPSRPLADYAGTYARPGYGEIEIWTTDAGLEFVRHEDRLPLEHYHYDTFRVPDDVWLPFPERRITFGLDRTGRVARVALPIEPALGEIVFERVDDAATTTAAAAGRR